MNQMIVDSTAMNYTMDTLEQSIRRLTAFVRQSSARETMRSFGENPEERPLGWWVLACGEPLDPEDFASRDRARDILRKEVEACGLMLPEYVWVWDDAEAAQLVITTLPSRDRAMRVAQKLRERGLNIRVRREKF